MAEQLASVKKKGGGGDGKILVCTTTMADGGANVWKHQPVFVSVTDPTATYPRSVLDDNFGHLDSNGDIVVDKAISKVYVSGQTYVTRNTSGTAVYSGVRVLKNGTVITGASATGTSSDASAYFMRIETSVAVGDVISIETLRTGGGYAIPDLVSIVTD